MTRREETKKEGTGARGERVLSSTGDAQAKNGDDTRPALLFQQQQQHFFPHSPKVSVTRRVHNVDLDPVPHDGEVLGEDGDSALPLLCLLYTSPSPRDLSTSRMPSSA